MSDRDRPVSKKTAWLRGLSEEKRQEYLRREKERQQQRLAAETPEQRAARLAKKRARSCWSALTEEQREKYRTKAREKARVQRATETPDEHEKRIARKRELERKRKLSLDPDERAAAKKWCREQHASKGPDYAAAVYARKKQAMARTSRVKTYRHRFFTKLRTDPERLARYQQKAAELRKHRVEDPQEKLERWRRYIRSPPGKLHVYSSTTGRREGVEWRLTDDEALFLFKEPCFYCGMPSIPGIACSGIDRVDSKAHYTLDNCVPACAMCNRMKWSYPMDEFVQKCREIVEHCLVENK
jgi:hypothetical protein